MWRVDSCVNRGAHKKGEHWECRTQYVPTNVGLQFFRVSKTQAYRCLKNIVVALLWKYL